MRQLFLFHFLHSRRERCSCSVNPPGWGGDGGEEPPRTRKLNESGDHWNEIEFIACYFFVCWCWCPETPVPCDNNHSFQPFVRERDARRNSVSHIHAASQQGRPYHLSADGWTGGEEEEPSFQSRELESSPSRGHGASQQQTGIIRQV